MEQKLTRIRELITTLNQAADAYYNQNEIMSNFEYDNLLNELETLENETGIIYPDSPTQNVGAEVNSSKRAKARHTLPAKSLDKTKDIDEYVDVFQKGSVNAPSAATHAVLMWKLDGGTICLTYDNGELVSAVTRGNGKVGSVITENVKYIKGIPLTIPEKDIVIVRGEAVMSYPEFDRIKDTPDGEKYKTPRNLANATILQEESVVAKREIQFFAFSLVKSINMPPAFDDRLLYMQNMGFQIVPFEVVTIDKLKEAIERWSKQVNDFFIPVDGLVTAYEDAAYAEALPDTGHHPNQLVGYAFKWADEIAETTLRKIEWSASRTGLLNPVAIFDPVELCGTTVSRASVHNVSTVMALNLKIGDKITVYKANMIIPQVADNLNKSPAEQPELPTHCPVCGREITIANTIANGKKTNTIVAKCTNPECSVKMIGKFTHFCERDCMNIDGMSEATVDKLVKAGFLSNYTDFYHLSEHEEGIVNMEGFGQKSYLNMIQSIENSRKTNLVAFLHALSIPNIGEGQAKLIAEDCAWDIRVFIRKLLEHYDWTCINGIGDVIHSSLDTWAEENIRYTSCTDNIYELIEELVFEIPKQSEKEQKLQGITFVITGDVHHFANRNALKEHIESLGGKVTGSVTSKTNYLINNDITSTSGKNKKAKEIGVEIITEERFLEIVSE